MNIITLLLDLRRFKFPNELSVISIIRFNQFALMHLCLLLWNIDQMWGCLC